MRRIWFALLLILNAGWAQADPVTMRAGNHADFARLVFSILPGTPWRAGRVGDDFAIVLDGENEIDPTGVFDRIPRDRIRDLRVEDTRLLIEFDCTCHIRPFLWQPDRLVVDVHDGKAPEGWAYDRPLDSPQTTLLSLPPDITPVAFPRPNPHPPIATVLDPFVTEEDNGHDVKGLEREVIESLSRAATQGLLSLSDEFSVSELPPAAPTQSNVPPAPPPEVETSLGVPGVSFQTSIDRDSRLVGDIISETQSGTTCLADTHFDIADWANDRAFADQIGTLRSAVTGEFDAIDPDAVMQLARGYLYFGFGREAIQVLRLDGQMSQDRLILLSLAQIMDEDDLGGDYFHQQISCDGSVAMWALLAQQDGAFDSVADRRAILRTFRFLPTHLQAHLASRLADRFLKLGDVDAAEAVLSGAMTYADTTVAIAIGEATVEAERGGGKKAADDLAALANTDSRLTPQAMLQLLTLNLAEGRETTAEQMKLVEAFRFENTGLDIAADLAAAQVKVLLQAQEFEAAYDILFDAASAIDESQVPILRDAYALVATIHMPDGAFLETSLTTSPTTLSAETANAMAQRLITLGFPDVAEEILETPATGAAMAERRYLRAMTALALGQFSMVEGHLSGMTTPRAMALRREVDRAQDGALPSRQLSANSTATEIAWQNKDWAMLATAEDPVLQAASALVLDDDGAGISPQAPLASGKVLLDQSARARQTTQELLDRFQIEQTDLSLSN